MLILGAPGSGKTTTLLQLARDLIAEIDPAFTRPIPVILNLSTWINRQQALDDWLIAELTTRYRVSSKAGRRWLRQRRLLPLLDGLDEVKLENRTACVQKINQLVADYGLHGAVVCSRYQDYNKLSIKLAFNRATYIQELTKEQVDEFLNQAGDKLASLREALRHDGALHSLAQSPLILNIMSLAYQNARAEDLADPNLNTDDARRRHLFDSYIQRMLQRKRGLQSYETHQTTKSMSWLARNMQRHNQEVFLFEGLQPSWLPSRSWQQIYFVVSGLISGLIVGLVFGFGWRLAASLGVLVGLTDLLRAEWLREPARAKRLPMFWWSILNITVTTLTVGLLLRPASLLITDQAFDWILVIGLGLLLGARGSRKNSVNYIQTGEALYWSSRKALRGLLHQVYYSLETGPVYLTIKKDEHDNKRKNACAHA